MKTIDVAFTGFWSGFDSKNNTFVDLLRKKYDVRVRENPSEAKYLFYGDFSYDFLNYRDCVRIYITGENLAPNFNLCDYALGFEHMIFEDRYVRYPLYMWGEYRNRFDRILTDEAIDIQEIDKRAFCSFVVSNDLFADPMRQYFFQELSKYKSVASGGRSYNNLPDGQPVKDKQNFLKNYRFNIAFENSSYPGYSTEKLVDAFAAHTVPIYWGDPRIAEVFNPDSFIDCTGKTIQEAVELVRKVEEDPKLYKDMLMAPAIKDTSVPAIMDQLMIEWLYHIFDQPYEKAKRIPNSGKMKVYEDNYRKKAKLEIKIKRHPIIYKIMKRMGQ